MAGLSGVTASNSSSAQGVTTSQNGDSSSSTGCSTAADMPNWLAGLMPQVAVAGSTANTIQTVPNSITPPNVSMPSLLEQMQLMGAAQMMSGGGASGANSLGGQPLNALAAALSQVPASTGAPPLTPNTAAALFAAAGNYGSPAKDAYCELCDKNFCNRYFLRTHRQKKHGITDESCSPMKSFPASPGAQLAGFSFQPCMF
uniref:C2H2-type domain-containing protein n=1 Tax=Parascaris equorum TaxID=6256 RepID=A0A914R7E3_PAREQ